jgi:hypothetical protein
MDWERQMPDGARSQSAASQAETGKPGGIGPADVADVLFDQLQFLVGHTGGNCSEDCSDCRRLQMVTDWLLLPFRCRNWA